MQENNLTVKYQNISELNPAPYNPRKWSKDATEQLTISIKKYGLVDPIIVNNASNRLNVVIGGHFRLKVAEKLGYKTIPVVNVNIPDEAKEKELNIRLNKNLGDWDFEMLAKFDEKLLADIGFQSEELDEIFDLSEHNIEVFDIEKELNKLDINNISVKKGEVYQLGNSRLMCGDSTIEEDFARLMAGKTADMCLTDPPYILDYQHAKRAGKPVTDFGIKKNRRYLETEILQDNFTELWMGNVAKHAKPDFSIICYENWKNLRVIWGEMEKHWKVKNMIVWHLPNRHQGFAAKHKFFSKHDIAVVGASGELEYNHSEEPEGLQEEFETALYAIGGKPHWEAYSGNKDDMPTDFIEYTSDDEKNSGQGIIFGTKPIEILIPYIKVLTKRGDLVVDPFCGSGSTLIACTKLKRHCYIMEKSPTYAEVALNRWEKLTGQKRKLIDDGKCTPKAEK